MSGLLTTLIGSNPYVQGAKLAAIGIALLAIVGYVAYERHEASAATARAEVAEKALNDYQAAAAAVIAERLAAQKATEEHDAQVAKDTHDAYQRDIASLTAHYAERLRAIQQAAVPAVASGSAAVPAPASAPSGTDAGTAVDDPTDRFVRELQSCDEDRAQLKALQTWIKETR